VNRQLTTRDGAPDHPTQLPRLASTPDLHSFPAVMPLGEFLFEYLHRCGVRHSFGIPGDFVLPTFAWLEKSKIKSVTMTHEPSAGFAADAYARVNGIGLVCVTYCVGGLNVLNAIAGAYAEKSPVVVISGAPGRKDREKDPLLHHKVKTFETQRRVYDEVTVAGAVLPDEQRAASEIVRCVEACLRHKRPVYIEVPHDMADRPIPTAAIVVAAKEESDPHTLVAALEETFALIRAAKKPVILAGVELARYRMNHLVVRMAERMNIPIAADLLSKSAVPENHPLYLGVYGGAMSSSEQVRRYVESADLVLMLGTFITDMSMGFYTAKLDRKRTVLATSERVNIRYHRYESIQFRDFLEGLANATIIPKKFRPGRRATLPAPLKKSERPIRSLSSMSFGFSTSTSTKSRVSLPISETRSLARLEFAAQDRRSSLLPLTTCLWDSPCPPASAWPWPIRNSGPTSSSATALFK